MIAELILPFLITIPARAQTACEDAFLGSVVRTPKKLVLETPYDLRATYLSEQSRFSKSTLSWMNDRALKQLDEDLPQPNGRRAHQVSFADAQALLNVMKEHPLIAREFANAYSQKDSETGFCFARAMYAHLMLLKMGVQEGAVKKIWAVGSQKSRPDGPEESFHVATAVFTPEGWMVIDPITFKPEPLRHWFSRLKQTSLDGRMRFYVTNAEKFGFALGVYDRIQLGLDLSPETDWYRGFFPRVLANIRDVPLEALGLRKVPVAPAPPATEEEPKERSKEKKEKKPPQSFFSRLKWWGSDAADESDP